MDYQELITVEPDKRGGQPCIRGLRITVYDVLSYLASGMTEEEIISDYPDLTHEDILASLSFRLTSPYLFILPIQASIRCSSTSIGNAPAPRTSSWKARMSKRSPSS